MSKRVRIGLIVVLCLVAIKWIFPFSFLSVYKSVTFKQDLVYIKNYQNELQEFKKDHEQIEVWDRIRAHTEYVLDFYEMDLMAAEKVKITKRDLNEMLDQVKNIRNTLIHISFSEELSEESRMYLEQSIYECFFIEDSIREMLKPNMYTWFQVKTLIGNLQGRLGMGLDIYSHFYRMQYGLE